MPNWRGLLDSEPIDKFLYDPASSILVLTLKTNLLGAWSSWQVLKGESNDRFENVLLTQKSDFWWRLTRSMERRSFLTSFDGFWWPFRRRAGPLEGKGNSSFQWRSFAAWRVNSFCCLVDRPFLVSWRRKTNFDLFLDDWLLTIFDGFLTSFEKRFFGEFCWWVFGGRRAGPFLVSWRRILTAIVLKAKVVILS